MRAERRTAAALALALLLGACLDPVNPDAVPVARVQLTFDGGVAEDTIPIRGTTRVRAAALAGAGHVLAREDFSYATADTTIAVVDAAGVVRGVRAGTTRVTAWLPEGTRGEATVVVTPTGVAYVIPVGRTPGALSFSVDYTRLYALVAPDSLAIVDALGYFRLAAVGLGLPAHDVAAGGDAVYVTHPGVDSVSVISTATSERTARLWVGAGPTGVAATAERAFVAARYDRRIVMIEDGRAALGIPVGGEPHHVAVARDGRRLFTTVQRDGAWRLVVAAPTFPDTLESLALSSEPRAIATDAAGGRVYVLLAGERRVVAFAEQADGHYRPAGSADVAADAGGLSVRPSGSPLLVSGEPAALIDATTMTVLERVPGVGSGAVAVRPDGVFAFFGAPTAGVLRVVGL